MTGFWFRLAAWLMAASVVLGAFGAHALRGRLEPAMLETYRIGVLYQMLHALGLFAVAWAASQGGGPRVDLAGALLTAGIVIFSGSLYALSLTGTRWLGAVTPIGGACFIAGWITLALSGFPR